MDLKEAASCFIEGETVHLGRAMEYWDALPPGDQARYVDSFLVFLRLCISEYTNDVKESVKSNQVKVSPDTLRLRKFLGEKVRTRHGVGILLQKETPSNGLYYEELRTQWTVWYGTDNSQDLSLIHI